MYAQMICKKISQKVLARAVEKALNPPLSRRGTETFDLQNKRRSKTEASNFQEFSDQRTKSSDNLTQNKDQVPQKKENEKDDEEEEESSDSDWGLEDPIETASSAKKSILKEDAMASLSLKNLETDMRSNRNTEIENSMRQSSQTASCFACFAYRGRKK